MSFFNRITHFLNKKNIYFFVTTQKKSSSHLFENEKKIIRNSNKKRIEDFATGRWCSRKVLNQMGLKIRAILNGMEGEPIWPKGVIGSISHTKGAYCAASAFQKYYHSIGVDIEERKRKISTGAIEYITNNDEKKWLKTKSNNQSLDSMLIFSSKESIFKLLYPVLKRRFYFKAVSIKKFNLDNSFTALVKEQLSHTIKKGIKIYGYFFYNSKWVVTLSYLKN